jgi:hypothetical protein
LKKEGQIDLQTLEQTGLSAYKDLHDSRDGLLDKLGIFYCLKLETENKDRINRLAKIEIVSVPPDCSGYHFGIPYQLDPKQFTPI